MFKMAQSNKSLYIRVKYHCNDCNLKYPCELNDSQILNMSSQPSRCPYHNQKAHWVKISQTRITEE